MSQFPIQPVRHYWWLISLWGILAAIFGICALIWPSLALSTLLYLFGIFAVVNGILGMITAFFERQFFPFWWIQLCAGTASLLLGIAVLIWPFLSVLLAIWAVITGIFQLSLAFGNRGVQPGTLLAIMGAVLIFLGIILFTLSPPHALLLIVWVIGLYALVYGGSLLWRAWFFHSLQLPGTVPHTEEY